MAASTSWRTALAYAVLGELPDGLAGSDATDPRSLVEELRAADPSGFERARHQAPYAVPAELRGDVGAAQLAAMINEVSPLLRPSADQPVVADRRLTPDERRLELERPPHHSS